MKIPAKMQKIFVDRRREIIAHPLFAPWVEKKMAEGKTDEQIAADLRLVTVATLVCKPESLDGLCD